MTFPTRGHLNNPRLARIPRTEKYRPPNRDIRWKSVKRLMKVRDNLYNQGTITQRQIDLYSALIRKTLKGSMKSWIKKLWIK